MNSILKETGYTKQVKEKKVENLENQIKEKKEEDVESKVLIEERPHSEL